MVTGILKQSVKMFRTCGAIFRMGTCHRAVSSSACNPKSRDLTPLKSDDIVDKFWKAVPPVVTWRTAEPPSAFKWLAKQLPHVPRPMLHGLFRRRQVRALVEAESCPAKSEEAGNVDGGAPIATHRPTRVSADRRVADGTVLLVPRAFLEAHALDSLVDGACVKNQSNHSSVQTPPSTSSLSSTPGTTSISTASKPSRGFSAAEAKWLRERVLYMDEHLMVINKPAGLAVQGGSGTHRHLDGMLDALRFEAQDRPRLVHRLDRDTSGALVLARSSVAAAALGEAFKSKTTQAKDHPGVTNPKISPGSAVASIEARHALQKGGAGVRRTYWALVQVGTTARAKESIGAARSGSVLIDMPLEKALLPSMGGERMVPVETPEKPTSGRSASKLTRNDGHYALTIARVRDECTKRQVAWMVLNHLFKMSGF